MCLPSVLGDGEAPFPSSRLMLRLPAETVFFHNCLPSVEAQINTRLSASADVRKMRSPQMIGVAPACPGSGNRQATLSVLLHVVGSLVSLLTPLLRGPRHWGQFSAFADVVEMAWLISNRASRIDLVM